MPNKISMTVDSLSFIILFYFFVTIKVEVENMIDSLFHGFLFKKNVTTCSVYLTKIIFANLFYYSTYFYYYSWILLHFLVLLMSLIVLFQLFFTFIYSTFSKKFSVSTK